MDLFQLDKLEKLIVHDYKLLFTLTSYVLILIIYMNSSAFQFSVLGIAASLLYFLINGIFLGHAFFEKEDAFFRLMLGLLLLIMLLGFVGWLAVIIYNLDVTRFTLVLFVVATTCSLLNRKVKHKNAT
jgi:uncharacterized membrane protein YfcA